MSAQVAITQLPAAGAITGTEAVPIVQNGVSVQTTTGAISASPSQIYQYLTVIQTAALPNSRYLSSNTGIGITNGGAQGPLTIALNGTSGSLESAGNGIVVKSSGVVVPRSIVVSGSGLAISNADGVSGDPTLALTGIAASIAALSGTGMLALTGGGTSISGRDLLGTSGQITVTDGDGSVGNPTFAITDNPTLPGVEGVVLPSGATGDRAATPTNGTLRYNTDTALLEAYLNGAWTSLASGSGVTSISTGTGLTGGPITSTGTISIANTAVTAGSYGSASKTLTATVNAQGQLTALAETNIAIADTQVSGLGTMSTQNASAVAITGGTIASTSISGSTGSFTTLAASSTVSGVGFSNYLASPPAIGGTTPAAGTFTSVAMTSGTITTTPSSGTDIVNKTYADSIASGINFHQSCRLATTTALAANTYNNGTSGVGATLTANANGALSVDSVAVALNNRILVKNEATQANNGVYTVTQTGSAGAPYILTRATDFDTAGTGVDQIDAGDFFLITAGTTLANTSWVQQTPLPITVGTTAIVFQQFGAPLVYSAGTGLTESPAYTFNIANTAVTSGAYGGAATVPTFSVNAQGQLTLATDVSIAIAGSQITSGSVAVANGGTGASTLTGYVKGNGTSAMTASATIPSTDITGLGTMSTQNAGTVAITGGTIDGTSIGATTASTGAFTTLNATTGIFGGTF